MNRLDMMGTSLNLLGKFQLRLATLATIVCLWELAAWRTANPRLFPDIIYVLTYSLPSLAVFSGYERDSLAGALFTLTLHTSYTLARVLVGLTIGASVGLLCGLVVHYFRGSVSGSVLLLNIIRAVPLFALVPLFLYWFGGGELGIYLYISFSTFIVIATNTYEAVLNVPPSYTQHAALMGATRFQTFKTVLVFAIQPQMVGSLRNVIGLSWAFSLGAEYLSARTGIGYLLYQSYLYADMGKLIVLASLYTGLGLLSFTLTRRLFASIRKWD